MKTKLAKELEKQDPEELLRLVKEMAKRFPVANMYLTMEFGMESQAIIDKYKKQLYKEYFPTRGNGKARSSRVNKTLKEFSQISAFQEDIVEMRFYQIELAVEYYKTNIHDYEPFLNNLYKNWQLVINLLFKEGLVSVYQERIDTMLNEKFSRYFVGGQLIEMWNNGPEIEEEEDLEE